MHENTTSKLLLTKVDLHMTWKHVFVLAASFREKKNNTTTGFNLFQLNGRKKMHHYQEILLTAKPHPRGLSMAKHNHGIFSHVKH